DGRHLVAPPARPHGVARGAHLRDVALEARDPRADATPVCLNLGLARPAQTHTATGTAATAAAAGLARKRLAPTTQRREEVLQLGQLDLSLAFAALGVLREDVEDQGRPVDDLDLDLLLKRAQLRRRELAIANNGVGAGAQNDPAQLLDLAAPDERRGIR